MHILSRSILAALALVSLAGCDGVRPNDAAYTTRGVENLLDVSSEVVNLGIAGPHEIDDLSGWVAKDQPSRAELYCVQGEAKCIEARKVLDLHGVPTMLISSPNNSVALVYERILARDCNPSFVDNSQNNNYNLNYPSFGCATAANTVMQVSDKQEFVNPNLSDNPSAKRAVTDYYRAYTPRSEVKPYTVENSALSGIGQK